MPGVRKESDEGGNNDTIPICHAMHGVTTRNYTNTCCNPPDYIPHHYIPAQNIIKFFLYNNYECRMVCISQRLL